MYIKYRGRFICSNCEKEFSEPTVDFFCDDCSNDSGILIEQIHIEKDININIFLLDCSLSMFSEIFDNGTISKVKYFSELISSVIFDVFLRKEMEKTYIYLSLFDHRINEVFNFSSIAEIVKEYDSSKKLQDFIYGEIESLKGQSNFDVAFEKAQFQLEKFINGFINDIYIPNVSLTPIINLKNGLTEYKRNIRCFIISDGDVATITPEKLRIFCNDKYSSNVIYGVYIGKKSDEGAINLGTVAGICPIHNQSQLIVLDKPEKIESIFKFIRIPEDYNKFCIECITTNMKIG